MLVRRFAITAQNVLGKMSGKMQTKWASLPPGAVQIIMKKLSFQTKVQRCSRDFGSTYCTVHVIL